jgi:methylated-DNA-protein-cysteine methyltransferase-like protein
VSRAVASRRRSVRWIARPPAARAKPRATAQDSYSRIWRVVRRIPRGRVATYGQIAALAGLPGRARLAGYALYALPEGSPLPWHRVVGAGGRLTIAKLDPASALTQRLKLEREGVEFDARWRVKLESHTWRAAKRMRRESETDLD